MSATKYVPRVPAPVEAMQWNGTLHCAAEISMWIADAGVGIELGERGSQTLIATHPDGTEVIIHAGQYIVREGTAENSMFTIVDREAFVEKWMAQPTGGSVQTLTRDQTRTAETRARAWAEGGHNDAFREIAFRLTALEGEL